MRQEIRNVASYLYLRGNEDITLDRAQTFLEEGLQPLLDVLVSLDPLTEEAVQYEFYEAAKRAFGEDRSAIREFFVYMYSIVVQRDSGPRWGQLVTLYGLDVFLDIVNTVINDPYGIHT